MPCQTGKQSVSSAGSWFLRQSWKCVNHLSDETLPDLSATFAPANWRDHSLSAWLKTVLLAAVTIVTFKHHKKQSKIISKHECLSRFLPLVKTESPLLNAQWEHFHRSSFQPTWPLLAFLNAFLLLPHFRDTLNYSCIDTLLPGLTHNVKRSRLSSENRWPSFVWKSKVFFLG